MDLFFKNWFRKRAEEREKTAQEQIKQQKLKDSCDKKFDAYRMFTLANSSRVNTIHTKSETNDTSNVKTTTVFTEFGPIVKSDVRVEKIVNGLKTVDNYTTYEGYVAPTEDENALSGYLELEKREICINNPVDRESYTFYTYMGFNRDALGNVSEINCRFEKGDKADKFIDVIKTFESRIKTIEEKTKKREDLER